MFGTEINIPDAIALGTILAAAYAAWAGRKTAEKTPTTTPAEVIKETIQKEILAAIERIADQVDAFVKLQEDDLHRRLKALEDRDHR